MAGYRYRKYPVTAILFKKTDIRIQGFQGSSEPLDPHLLFYELIKGMNHNAGIDA
jgi:hypothetical protein